MNHAGSSPCPEDSSSNSITNGAGSECTVKHLEHPNDQSRKRTEASHLGEQAPNLPVQTARADAATCRNSLPFVVQAGPTLFMVAEESSDWVIAELNFDAASCAFMETRRAHYSWPREVFGRLLSRTMTDGELDLSELNHISEAFSGWMAQQFVTNQGTA